MNGQPGGPYQGGPYQGGPMNRGPQMNGPYYGGNGNPYMNPQPKKPNTGLILGLAAIAATLILALVVIFTKPGASNGSNNGSETAVAANNENNNSKDKEEKEEKEEKEDKEEDEESEEKDKKKKKKDKEDEDVYWYLGNDGSAVILNADGTYITAEYLMLYDDDAISFITNYCPEYGLTANPLTAYAQDWYNKDSGCQHFVAIDFINMTQYDANGNVIGTTSSSQNYLFFGYYSYSQSSSVFVYTMVNPKTNVGVLYAEAVK